MAKRKKVNTQPFWRFAFLVYLALMLWLLFGRSWGWQEGVPYRQLLAQHINLKLFHTIENYWYIVTHRPDSPLFAHCLINLAGNVVMFIPAGWLLPRLWRRFSRFFRFLLTSFLIILLIESLQLLTLLGSFDVDDIVLNLIGMITGYLFWKLGSRK